MSGFGKRAKKKPALQVVQPFAQLGPCLVCGIEALEAYQTFLCDAHLAEAHEIRDAGTQWEGVALALKQKHHGRQSARST